jgi:hypothetical protein
MTISSEQIRLLESYRDKAYITSFYVVNRRKFANICLNTWTILILSLVSNFKLPEQVTNFAQIQVKFNDLCHLIKDKLRMDLESCKIEDKRQFISEYDTLYEKLDHSFPTFIVNKVKKVYAGKKVLPNSLNCEFSFTVAVGQYLV